MTLHRLSKWLILFVVCGVAALSSSAYIVIQSISSGGDSTAESSISNSKTKFPSNQSLANPNKPNDFTRPNHENTRHEQENLLTNDAGEEDSNDDAENTDENESNENTVESSYPEKGFNSSLGLGGNMGGGGGPSEASIFFHNRYVESKKRDENDQEDFSNVMQALYWLRDHQNPKTGSWSADKFVEQCNTNSPSTYYIHKLNRNGICTNLNGTSDAGLESYSNVVTGLATLAFLGAGYTHDEGEFKLTVKRALRYMLSIQYDTGCFGSKDDESIMYSHVLCTQALIEGYAMTQVAKLKAPAQMAVDFIASAQNDDPHLGWLGWGFNYKDGKSNSYVTSWIVLALTTADKTGLKVPERCFEGAQNFLRSVTSHPALDKTKDKYPRTGFEAKFGNNTKYEKTPMMDAMNIFSCRLMGIDESNSFLRWQAELIAYAENGNMPTTDKPEKIDFLYWNFASLAMFQMGDSYWRLWKEPAYDSIIKLQRLENEDTCAYGSWDPIDAWGNAGGRVYATAINALTLETEYRYNFID